MIWGSISDVLGLIVSAVTAGAASYAAIKANAIANKQLEEETSPKPKLDFVIAANWDKQSNKMAGYNCTVVNYGKAPAVLNFPQNHTSVLQVLKDDVSFLPQNRTANQKDHNSYNNPIETCGYDNKLKSLQAGTRPETFWNSVIVQPQQSETFFCGTTRLKEIVYGSLKQIYFHIHESHENKDYLLRLDITENDGLTLTKKAEIPCNKSDSEMNYLQDANHNAHKMQCQIYRKLVTFMNSESNNSKHISIFSDVAIPTPQGKQPDYLDFVVTSVCGVEAVKVNLSQDNTSAALDKVVKEERTAAKNLHILLEQYSNNSVHRTVWSPDLENISTDVKDDPFLSIKSFNDNFTQTSSNHSLTENQLSNINQKLVEISQYIAHQIPQNSEDTKG